MRIHNIVPVSLLLAMWTAPAWSQQPAADTLEQLAAEANSSTVNGAPAPVVQAAADPASLMEKITKDLESYLKVAPDQPIKKEAVVEVANKAKAEGGTAFDIQQAVSMALDALAGKGVRFEPGTHAFIQASMQDLLTANADLAQGDPADAYIRSLNAELAGTEVSTFGSGAKAAGPTATAAAPAPRFDMSSQKGPRGTITVLAGESLSVIAQRVYGDAALYPLIFEANRNVLPNPNVVSAGQILRIPPLRRTTPVSASEFIPEPPVTQ